MLTTLNCSSLLHYRNRIIDRLRLTSKQHLFAQPYAVLQVYFSSVNSLSTFLVGSQKIKKTEQNINQRSCHLFNLWE